MKRKLLIFAVVLATLGVLVYCFRRYLTIGQLIEHEAQVKAYLADYPVRSFLAGMLIYVLASLVPGTTGKALVCGWLFGFWQGVVIVNASLTLAALLTFLFSRYVFRDMIQKRYGRQLRRVNAALERDGGYYLFALRVLHVPYTLTNYAMGASTIKTRTFVWCTQVGLLPSNAVFVYAGMQFPSLKEIVEQGVTSVIRIELVVALLMVSLLPLVLRYLVRKLWPRVEKSEL